MVLGVSMCQQYEDLFFLTVKGLLAILLFTSTQEQVIEGLRLTRVLSLDIGFNISDLKLNQNITHIYKELKHYPFKSA